MNAAHVRRAGVWPPSGTPALLASGGGFTFLRSAPCGGGFTLTLPRLPGRARFWARGVVMELKSKSLVQGRFGAFAATYATSRPHATWNRLLRRVELVSPQGSWLVLGMPPDA